MQSDKPSDRPEDQSSVPTKFFLFEKDFETFERILKKLQENKGNENLIEELKRYVPDDFQNFAPVNNSNTPWRGDFEMYVDREESDPSPYFGYGWPLVFPNEAKALEVLAPFLQDDNPQIQNMVSAEITATPMDLALPGQHWCAGSRRGSHFGTWQHARTLIGADALRTAGPGGAPLTGANVNVFVVDQGISRSYVQSLGGTYGGGMDLFAPDGFTIIKKHGEGKDPYTALPLNHGAMMVRTILDLAPNARIFDLPLLPDRITSVPNFVSTAIFAYFFLKEFFLNVGAIGPWIVVNPWGVVSRFGETIRFDYTGNTANWLNQKIDEIATEHDVIFSAGNSGQFCPNPRAPGYDVGPGESIFGANGLDAVTSVGAVRSDGAWIGTSSQGPASFHVTNELVHKPDFCAPSWYVDHGDAALRSTGTSAASAVAAGVIAALRSGWADTAATTPADLRQALRDSARKVSGSGWSNRTGHGVLNVPATVAALPEHACAQSVA